MKPPNATPKPNRNEVKDEENLRLGVNCLFSMDSFFLLQFRKEMAGRLQFNPPANKKLDNPQKSVQGIIPPVLCGQHQTSHLQAALKHIYKNQKENIQIAKHGRSLATFGTCQKHPQHSK